MGTPTSATGLVQPGWTAPGMRFARPPSHKVNADWSDEFLDAVSWGKVAALRGAPGASARLSSTRVGTAPLAGRSRKR